MLPRPLPLDVTNRGANEVVVYLAEGASSMRLGSVRAFQRARFFIHRGQGLVRLLVRPLGSPLEYAPEPVWVGAGQVMELTVQPLLGTSLLFVR
jgi:hypothetical protein